MLAGADFAVVMQELDHWSSAGQPARLWLRDDDAHQPTPALDRLLGCLAIHRTPCLLAVIPQLAGGALASRLASEPLVHVAVHGARHINHAPPGRKSEETPDERGFAVNMADLKEARARLCELFGPSAGDWYVPPWNRIGSATAAGLPGLGFRAVSTFRTRHLGVPGLRELNTHVDLMDWKGGRTGKSAGDVATELASELARARAESFRPVGILAHHLVHDETAWSTLGAMLDCVHAHPAARWQTADALVA
jgi:hypothetical protein